MCATRRAFGKFEYVHSLLLKRFVAGENFRTEKKKFPHYFSFYRKSTQQAYRITYTLPIGNIKQKFLKIGNSSD
jgi:hypothetical protein